MNYNLISYSIYIFIIVVVMIKVGSTLYENGEIYLIKICNGNINIAYSINKILLIGFYLVNFGYGIFTISLWENIVTLIEMTNELATKLGVIFLILAVLHYNNILLLKLIVKQKQKAKTK